MAGYAGGTDEESVEALVTEAFGMSTVDYLMSWGPNLLPTLEELQAQYDGSGTYQAAEGILIRQFMDGYGQLIETRVERYIRKDASMVLTQENDAVPLGFFADHYPVVYTLQQPPKQ